VKQQLDGHWKKKYISDRTAGQIKNKTGVPGDLAPKHEIAHK
jgi:hypothetical protein